MIMSGGGMVDGGGGGWLKKDANEASNFNEETES